MQDYVIPRPIRPDDSRIPFEINDVELLIDPIQISIYKEGLNYSWKTLRTKASSKIVNGNSVFHLKLNLIFTKSMFLEMHRLICQIRNTPYVQITNELIGESVSVNKADTPVFFTVNSLQVMPRSDSPFTVDMELDLRYFNHKPYGALRYKDKFETLPHLKKDKQYVYTFDVFPNEDRSDSRIELKIPKPKRNKAKPNRKTVNNNTFLKRSIKKYNSTIPVQKASESNAYKRYSNYLQIKNLIECFNFNANALRELLGNSGVNAREVVSLCNISDELKASIYNHQNIYGADSDGSSGYISTVFSYQEYVLLKTSKETNRALREYFETNIKDIQDYSKRRKRTEELKIELFKKLKNNQPKIGKFDFTEFKNQIDAFKNTTLNYYTERSNVNNVVFSNKTISVTQNQNFNTQQNLPSNACITSFSCGFTNMFSTIPIAGQEYPTHQYLGASEPVFNVNILLPSAKGGEDGPDRGLGDVGKEFESMRFQLQKNAKDFKRIPDAGYFGVENFFTKLLGSKKTELDAATNKSRNNFILRNFNVSTIEGAPGAKTLQFSFCETNDFVEEELGKVYTQGGSNEYTNRVNELFSKSAQRPRKKNAPTNYAFKNWKTRYFSSDPTSPNDYYYLWVKRGRSLDLITQKQDKKAFEFCRNYLDPIQDALGGREVNIGSSIDRPSTGKRKTASRHYSGAAVDISVKGMTPAELAVVIHNVLSVDSSKRFGVIAYYRNRNDFITNKKMTGFLEKSFFVHVDDRTVVKRDYQVDPKTGKRTYVNDPIEITDTKAGTYYGLDINDQLGGKPQGKSVEDFYKVSNSEFTTPSSKDLEESDVDIENILNSTDIRQRLKTYINPFSADIEKEYEDVEVTRYKDLEEAEQTIVASIRPNPDSVNPELEVSIIEESNAARASTLEARLQKQGINYKKEGDKFFIPRSSSNRSIVVKNKQIEAYLTMLDNFYKLASLMLTEPKLYMAGEAAAAQEKERIRRLLKDDKITPILFNSFEKFFDNIGRMEELLSETAMAVTEAAGIYYTVGAATSAKSLNLPAKIIAAGVTLLAGAAILANISNIDEALDGSKRYTDCMSFIKSIRDKNKIASEYTEFSQVVPEGFEIKPNESFSDFFQNVASADQVALNFGKVSHYIIYESNLIKDFSTSATNIIPKSKVALALGTYSDIKKTVDDKGYQLKGALSETLFMGELKRYHQYIFEFPYVSETFDEEDFFNLYEYKKNGLRGEYIRSENKKKYLPYENRTSSDPAHKYLYSVNQIVDQGVRKIDIPFTKEELKQRQDLKLEYLKNLKESILEELGEFPEIQEALGVNREVSIFELAQENAYPDITLPLDPANLSNNANLHPTFYFFDPVEESLTRSDWLRPELSKNVESVMDKSNAFFKALETGIFSGSERDFVKNQNSLKLEINDFPTFERLLIDKNDEGGPKVNNQTKSVQSSSQASQTNVTASPTAPPNLEDQSALFEDRKKKFESLNKSFENMFGEIGERTKIEKTKDGGIPLKSLKEQAKESCKTLLKPKKDIKKAFPTYRLYIIEEDSVESDKLSVYDDFYSYNGVKGFTVYSNKKLPTSTAVIQLQNISGVLDGTKPEVVRDIDINQNLKPEEEAQQQASISSVVMRPGINIQLRAGYEANPNKLDIIFTGRVTELKNSSAGEMIEIVAQSFGTELIARKYGLQSNSPIKEKTFYNTHSLLGTLMLSEELKHFGRVKKGRLFQRGENKQISLDLDTGKNNDWFNFSVLSWTQRFFEDYGIYVYIATSFLQGASGLVRRGASLNNKFLTGVQTQFKNIANGQLIKGGAKGAVAYTRSLSAVRSAEGIAGAAIKLAAGVGNKIPGSKAVLDALRFTGGKLSGLPKFIFITTPRQIRNKIESLTLTKYLGGKDFNSIITAKKGLVGNITIDKKVFGSNLYSVKNLWSFVVNAYARLKGKVANPNTLSVAEFNAKVIRKYGYNYAAGRSLLLSPGSLNIGLTQAFLSSTQIFGGGTLLRNFTTNYITALYISAVIDGLIGVFNMLSSGAGSIFGEKLNPATTKIMLSPQDDNIYPPSPSKYLVQSSGFETYVSQAAKGLKDAGFTLLKASMGILGYGYPSDDDTQAKLLKNAYLKADNRLSVSKKENNYIVSSSTIWEVLHEMSLRHPGYLYGIRKYGDGLESRVFFGYSNQRCFVKDLPTREIQLLNKIEAAVKNMKADETTFSEDTIKNILNLKQAVKNDEVAEKTNQILDYWISKTTERFVPFRKYHSVDSEHDIIANNLRVQNNKVVNQVAVTFRSDGEDEKIHIMKAFPYLSEERINEKGINYVNCRGYASACRYGMGELIHSAKEMYGGEILIVGNPKIDTNDICILTDDYSNMHGLFEVEAITHMFSYETGFVTELVPNAVVFGNENYLGSISSSSIAFDAHRKLIDTYTNYNQLLVDGEVSDEKLEAIAEAALLEVFSESENSIYNALYRGLGNIPYVGLTDYSELNNDDKAKLIEEVKNSLKKTLKKGNAIFLEDITGAFNTSVANTSVNRSSIVAGGIGTLATSILTKNIGAAISAGIGTGVLTNIAGKGAVSSIKTGYLGKNIFRDLLVTQIEAGHMIKLLPIVKDGSPLVTGGYEYLKQHQRFKDVFGNFFNPLSDAIEGFTSRVKELEEEYKMLGVNTYGNVFDVGLRRVPVYLSGVAAQYLSADAIPAEAVWMQLEK